jgi:hypothetical protein
MLNTTTKYTDHLLNQITFCSDSDDSDSNNNSDSESHDNNDSEGKINTTFNTLCEIRDKANGMKKFKSCHSFPPIMSSSSLPSSNIYTSTWEIPQSVNSSIPSSTVASWLGK